MEINASSGDNINGTFVYLTYDGDTQIHEGVQGVPQSLKSQMNHVLSNNEFDSKAGSTVTLLGGEGGKAIFIGLGKKKNKTDHGIREAGALLVSSHNKRNGTEYTVNMHGFSAHDVLLFAEGAMLRDYSYELYKSKKNDEKQDLRVRLNCDDDILKSVSTGLTRLEAITSGVHLSRDLGNCPPNDMYPMEFATRAVAWAKQYNNVEVTIIGYEEAVRLGMGGLVGVGKGSDRKPCMVIFKLNGDKKGPHPVLVGKGITFDTGGISLKPGPSMDEMKYDMGGSATVFGTMQALAAMGYEGKVVGITCMAENMPSAWAQRPGDVITTLSGKTIEVLNTDAEGRLVLADGLWKAGTDFEAEYIIDFATLTGACVIALGHEATGLWSNDDDLLKKIQSAGNDVGELAWPMPLLPAFEKEMTDSQIADTRNLGSGRWGGANTAAAFLKQFVPYRDADEEEQVPWAHMDIAGTYWGAKTNKMVGHGATGIHVRTMVRLITGE